MSKVLFHNFYFVILKKFFKMKLGVLFLASRSRRKMQTVSNISITGMLVMYLLAALFGYLTFYGRLPCPSPSLFN